jgi:two-component system, NtrC family, nitrogen regulation sensor histidine kinase NtrY
MSYSDDSRRWTVALLAAGVLLLIVALGGLQAFNTSNIQFLNPVTSGETLLSTSLIVLVFLLLLLLVVLLLRNILKVYAGQGSGGLGARLRSRMMVGAILIALAPTTFMFMFSYGLMNRSLDRWFSPNTSELREDSSRVVVELARYVTANARQEAESITATGAPDRSLKALQDELSSHRITMGGGFVVVYDKDQRMLASFQAPAESSSANLIPWPEEGEPGKVVLLHGPLSASLLSTARRGDEPVMTVASREYVLGLSATASGRMVVVAQPMPQGLRQSAMRIRTGSATYWELFRNRNQIRAVFFEVLLVITVLCIFLSVWMARFLSTQITRPVEALGVAMVEIAAGKYDHRVGLVATGEMGELVRAFNHMAADLDTSRQLAESSSAQLTAANLAIEERRRELEAIVETIPSGVVTLDGAGMVLQANRAFAALMGRRLDLSLGGEKIETLFPAECAEDLTNVMRRGQRMGTASTDIEVHVSGRTMHLTITSARFELTRGQPGTVLVVEDTTEFLRAQRQLAWKEVAQRVAHEIKNPLTPIALSAERIGRHLDRPLPDSPAVIRKCSTVILSCVGTLRTLVDQFSALAQFPTPQPRACDINQVIEEALVMFAGRLDGITVQRNLEPELPPVLADPVAIRRALANLIDNAAEAMEGSLLCVLGVGSSLSEDGVSVEVEVSDTGHGLTDEIRERLFLPFYSTKHRGTGLGLSIAAKIVQEHGGSLRAESNSPKGARFLLRLPLMEPRTKIGAQAKATGDAAASRPDASADTAGKQNL